ncbi:MAG TPA: ribosomal protein S18-alanine N-acetyltransferase [Dissulfurispiraceae bacterium]|nr:ribosomal protein S18-alanine N-acetyltransferase [Dissulfurispiraceae bacterium]
MTAESEGVIFLRQIVPDDVPALLAIEQLCFSTPWSQISFLNEVRSRHSLSLLAESEVSVVGYVIVRLVADECHLHDLAVHPDRRRSGVARLLMQKVLTEVRETDKRFFFLEVRASNHAAISLYESLGFRFYAKRMAYYENPQEDAALMRLDFNADSVTI